MTDEIADYDLSARAKLESLYHVAKYRPIFTAGIICLSIVAAILEGIGLSFLIPVIEIVQGSAEQGETSGVGRALILTYDTLGVPFTLGTVIVGASIVMIVRYASSFLVAFLREALRLKYIQHLKTVGFENALDASISYYDENGSDEILNAIITQTEYASRTIRGLIMIVEKGFLSLMYLAVALYLSPWMTLLTGLFLGGGIYGIRWKLESGYSVGSRVADANERVQQAVQAGTQGIREVKLFGREDELFGDFRAAMRQFTNSTVRLRRNQTMINNTFQMMTALTVFGLIYVGIRFASLRLASLGVFLFAMFRLAPRLSEMSDYFYEFEGNLPHLVRTQRFVEGLQAYREMDSGTLTPPDPVNHVGFEDVAFSYGQDSVLDGLSFGVDRGEFVAFVGPSGAGKSTIVSLLTRTYDPDAGRIVADETGIEQFVLGEWRSKLSVVRQDPHLFNKSLRYNVTLGNRDATEAEIREACEIAQVTEFLDELPDGLDTVLGDDGVRLSGGQRQRVAIARALLKDADVLVLDEATSNLDTRLEERVHDGIEELSDYAMIVIAHRLSTVTGADRIYAMQDGRIQEQGPHEQLLEQRGTYAEMYAKQ